MKAYLTDWIKPGNPPYSSTCYIWSGWESTITELHEPTGPQSHIQRGYLVDSKRAGGQYVLWSLAQQFMERLDDQQKARLTTWLIDQRNQGDPAPEITIEKLRYAVQRPTLQVQERAERLLKHIASQANTIGAGVDIQNGTPAPYAWSESTEWEELVFLLNYLRDSGWLNHTGTNNRIFKDTGLVQGVVTVAGFNQISNQSVAYGLAKTPAMTSITIASSIFQEKQFTLNEKLVFLLSPFGEPFDGIFADHIKPTVEKIGELNCLRADDIYDIQPVIDDIWRLTNEAKIIIAELTGKNANVFYETGLAHAIGKEVILITQSMDDVPFDLQHHRYIRYEYTPPGIAKFEHELTNTITSILNRTNQSGSSP